MAYTGKYAPINPKKYKGDPSNIVYRSMWERKVFVWCDTNESVLDWQSEEFFIKYRDPSTGKIRSYFPDLLITTRQADKTIKKKLIEIKPFAQTQEPKKQSRITKRYITEVATYLTNKAKWSAANEYALDHGYEFVILTEKEIFPKQYK